VGLQERGSNGASGVVGGVGGLSWLLADDVAAGAVVVVVDCGAPAVAGPAAGGGGGFTLKVEPVVTATSEPAGVGPWAMITAPDS
jgi:hypothetical protein